MPEKPTYQELKQRIIELEKIQFQQIEEIEKLTELRTKYINPSLTAQHLDSVTFNDLFNLNDIQQLQDQFANATGVASIITQPDGTPITMPSNFCRLCKDIIRKTVKGCANCYRSDAIIGRLNPDGPTISCCMGGGLWDAGAAISIGGKHIANWLIGQVRDETQTEENIRKYARQIGADESEMVQAFYEIPAMSRRHFEDIAEMLFTLANQLSGNAFHNLQLERSIVNQKKTEEALRKSEAYLKTLMHTIPDLIWLKDPQGVYLFCNSIFELFFGAKEEEIIGKTDYDFVDQKLADFFRRHDKLAIEKGVPSKNEEEVTFASDGHYAYLETIKTPIYDRDGRLIGVLGIGRDITERKEAEEKRLANITFLENLDRINLAIHSTNDIEQMMRNVLDATLSIFKCDRAHLLFPCDPETAEWQVPMERTRAEYPGAFAMGIKFPTTPFMKQTFQNLLEIKGSYSFSVGSEVDDDETSFKQFGIKSILAIALYPKIGLPWLFGLQQCSHIRTWTIEEKRLFQEISRRLADGLTSLLMYRDLQKSEESYRAIWNTVPYPIVITTQSDQKILQLNDAFTHHYNRTRKEAIGAKLIDLKILFNPVDERQFYDTLSRYGHVDSMPVRFHLGDHDEQETLISIRPIRFQSEDCYISVNVDVTEQKRIQRALKESESRFRIIFENAADPIFLTDIETGRFLDVNQAGCRHLGYTKEEFRKLTLDQVKIKGAFDPIAYFKGNKKESIFYESKNIHKDGSITISEISCRRMRHQNRTILLGIVRDVTRRKQIEEELKRYRENLEKMVEERTEQLKEAQSELVKKEKLAVLGQLTATVSHELRNPLGVIRSSNFFLQRKFKQSDEKAIKHFKRIEEQVSICDTIVADLLEYTRGRKVTISKADLSPWLAQVVEQLEEQHEIKITLEIPPNLPVVPHDQEKMRRVVINLLTNAMQAVLARKEKETVKEFSPNITLTVDRKKDNVAISVSDNGIGMDQETRKRAFEPLFTTRAKGTGIGLAIVKKVVEEHDGAITVDSKPGKGTRISLFLPVIEE